MKLIVLAAASFSLIAFRIATASASIPGCCADGAVAAGAGEVVGGRCWAPAPSAAVRRVRASVTPKRIALDCLMTRIFLPSIRPLVRRLVFFFLHTDRVAGCPISGVLK